MDVGTRTKAGPVRASRLGSALWLVGLLLMHGALHAEQEDDAKVLSGMSIIGNDEAPKSLFIVPWKTSEIGSDTSLTSGLLDDSMRPIDREVFMREINFYEIRNGN